MSDMQEQANMQRAEAKRLLNSAFGFGGDISSNAVDAAIGCIINAALLEMASQPKAFDTEDHALEWMKNQIVNECGDPYISNYRFSSHSDLHGMMKYEISKAEGCCKSFDETVIIAGSRCVIGCNYDHGH